MKASLDLSNLQTGQADLWLFLHVDAILARIRADQTKCWESNTTLRPRRLLRSGEGETRDLSLAVSSGRSDLETFCGSPSEPVPPRTLPTFSAVIGMHVVSSGL